MKNILPILVFLLILLIALAVLFFMPRQDTLPKPELPEGTHRIVLAENGFVPDTLVIKKGETVVFSTDQDGLFWPASNLHPSHLEYEDFDPKMPIKAGSEWSFAFEQTGVWEYHDHLAPYFTGVITVTE